jgi:hypothetical protein
MGVESEITAAWLERAATLSDQDGPVKRISLKEVFDQQPSIIMLPLLISSAKVAGTVNAKASATAAIGTSRCKRTIILILR